jgi:hypothetical protein
MPQNLREAIQTFVNDLDFKPLASNRWVLNPALTTRNARIKTGRFNAGGYSSRLMSCLRNATQELNFDDFDQNAIDISVKILNILSRAQQIPLQLKDSVDLQNMAAMPSRCHYTLPKDY